MPADLLVVPLGPTPIDIFGTCLEALGFSIMPPLCVSVGSVRLENDSRILALFPSFLSNCFYPLSITPLHGEFRECCHGQDVTRGLNARFYRTCGREAS